MKTANARAVAAGDRFSSYGDACVNRGAAVNIRRVAVILKLSMPHDILADSTYRHLNLSYNCDEQICCRFAADSASSQYAIQLMVVAPPRRGRASDEVGVGAQAR
jgi:hypothetical protein